MARNSVAAPILALHCRYGMAIWLCTRAADVRLCSGRRPAIADAAYERNRRNASLCIQNPQGNWKSAS
jgi:hypothetical protein